jgi:hypothetical protein
MAPEFSAEMRGRQPGRARQVGNLHRFEEAGVGEILGAK